MKNKSVSDYVAAAMDATLKSEEHKSLFNSQYKYASATCEKCKSSECNCDSSMAWDENDARKAKKEDSEESSSSDSSSEDDSQIQSEAALDVAIDSLLTASGALDFAGLTNGATLSLKLASLVVEAKKKKQFNFDKKKSNSSDSNSAKDKAAKEKAAMKAKEDKAKADDKARKEKEAKLAKEKAEKAKAKKSS